LFDCVALAATAVLAPVGGIARPTAFVMKDIPLNELSYAALAAQVNTHFRVQVTPARTVRLELLEANAAPESFRVTGGNSARFLQYERFSLIFRGARDEPLEQRIYRFEHEQIGRFEMFIVPVVSRDTTSNYYEAIFHR
jgi:hypothetical protein